MTALKSCLAYLQGAPQLVLAMRASASAALVAFFAMFCRWLLKFNFLSTVTPRYLASLAGLIIIPLISRDASVVLLVLRVKWTRMYFDGSNWAPCFRRHISACCRIWLSFFAFSLSDLPLTPYMMSSIKPKHVVLGLWGSKRSAL